MKFTALKSQGRTDLAERYSCSVKNYGVYRNLPSRKCFVKRGEQIKPNFTDFVSKCPKMSPSVPEMGGGGGVLYATGRGVGEHPFLRITFGGVYVSCIYSHAR